MRSCAGAADHIEFLGIPGLVSFGVARNRSVKLVLCEKGGSMGIPTILVIGDNFADVTLLRLALDELRTAYRLKSCATARPPSRRSPAAQAIESRRLFPSGGGDLGAFSSTFLAHTSQRYPVEAAS
jgi:hypothetical protein